MSLNLYRALRPLLFTLDPERAHSIALSSLSCAHSLGLLRRPKDDPSAAVSLMGLRFPNRLGLAAGFDKNGRYVDALAALGVGCIEVGTVTPRSQPGQSRPRLFRLPQAGALINRMGFPSEGAAATAKRLSRRTFAAVCGVNIGKNASTEITQAVHDYLECFRALAPHADYVAVNVSSPNTKDLRRLQQVDRLQPILEALLEERARLRATQGRQVPLLVKISADLSLEELVRGARLIRELGIDGVIATNSTVSRTDVSALRSGGEEGGLSGAPLLPLAMRAVEALRATLGAGVAIIAVGGIDSGADAVAALKAGADLIQVYTGLVYRGPALIREILTAVDRADPQRGGRTARSGQSLHT